jgi:hypothetical protein
LQIRVKLRSRISGDLAVGSLIDGVVATNVSRKGEVMIAAKSPVRGRIRRLEHYTEPLPHFVVALEFTELELQGIRHRFYADLLETDSLPGLERRLTVSDRTESVNLGPDAGARGHLGLGGKVVKYTGESLSLTDLPGVAAFFLKGGKLDLPPGFETVWRTRPWVP